ncbi:MAG: TIGR01212 family radical SAM protein [Eubacteriales bacterium]|nr:TIGR01212 family radical SAM protein [Eubacteriales bacterium]
MLLYKNGARYNSIGPWLKDHFGKRTVKAAIDAGFTCPNRDGKKGFGGCIYCSEEGSGEYAGTVERGISTGKKKIAVPVKDDSACSTPAAQITSQINFIKEKWSDPLCIAYFQSFTNTYAPVDHLELLYRDALSHPDCVGLAIATRPDCIGDDVLDLLQKLNEETFLWVELGLQTADDRTAELINRGCTLAEYDNTADRLIKSGIRVVTHLIFGLPGEDRDTMLRSTEHVCEKDIFGIKFHMLNILKHTAIENMWSSGSVSLMTRDEYISLVCDALEIIPRNITIHRLTGDAPAELLLAPDWIPDKRAVLNGINSELKKRGSVQGCRLARI